jgi:hypothetical protein
MTNFRISTAALGMFHSIAPLNGDGAAVLRVVLNEERARVAGSPHMGSAFVSGALVVEPKDLDRIVARLERGIA